MIYFEKGLVIILINVYNPLFSEVKYSFMSFTSPYLLQNIISININSTLFLFFPGIMAVRHPVFVDIVFKESIKYNRITTSIKSSTLYQINKPHFI